MMRRVGRPGLVGTMARTAVVAGTATAVSGGMVRHAQKKEMAQQQDEYYQQQMMQQQIDQAAAAAVAAQQPAAPVAAAPAPAPAAAEDPMITKIKELAQLNAAGILSDEEFAAAKARLLS
jgi:putative oligomerization/nucleic acid binding protein